MFLLITSLSLVLISHLKCLVHLGITSHKSNCSHLAHISTNLLILSILIPYLIIISCLHRDISLKIWIIMLLSVLRIPLLGLLLIFSLIGIVITHVLLI